MIGKKKKKKAESTQPAVRLSHYDVLRGPVITEKSTMATEQGKVVFLVSPDASKTEIRAAVEALFGVKVTKVNTLTRKGKAKGFRGNSGRQSDTRRAVVTLTPGQSIDFAAGVR